MCPKLFIASVQIHLQFQVNTPRLEDDGKHDHDQQQKERSHQSVQEGQNGNVMTTGNASAESLSNGEVKGEAKTINNSQPKSCLKKKTSSPQTTTNGLNNNNHHEELTTGGGSRSRKSSKIKCCLIS